MNTKNRIKNLYKIAPEYHRIPHLSKSISNMTHDDIELESALQFPFTCWVTEKVDGANMGVSWTSGPIIRNRNNILKKGYIKKETPAKLQFRPAWNWIHEHGKEIRQISEQCLSNVTLYGEWILVTHSIAYNKLPDWFLVYDIYSVEDNEYLAPNIVEDLLKDTNIKYIKPHKVTFNSIEEIVEWSEKPSEYRSGIREGIVLKTTEGRFVDKTFKVVNKYFKRREDFNEKMTKNILKQNKK